MLSLFYALLSPFSIKSKVLSWKNSDDETKQIVCSLYRSFQHDEWICTDLVPLSYKRAKDGLSFTFREGRSKNHKDSIEITYPINKHIYSVI